MCCSIIGAFVRKNFGLDRVNDSIVVIVGYGIAHRRQMTRQFIYRFVLRVEQKANI